MSPSEVPSPDGLDFPPLRPAGETPSLPGLDTDPMTAGHREV